MPSSGAGLPEARGSSRTAGLRSERVRFEFGRVAVSLDVPADLERYVDAQALLRDPEAPEPPYWLHLWTGSRALARIVAERDDWAGRRVADVGCGLGLAGLVAARLGARAVLIDHIHEALRAARANARLNDCHVEVVQADLLRSGVRGRFDVVLLADVTYDPALQKALAVFLAENLAEDGVGLCAESVRHRDPGFHRACEELGLRLGEREIRETDEGRPVPVRLTEVMR
jgi:predicted nicotinamide N-methyase